jgi:hypothetical protein
MDRDAGSAGSVRPTACSDGATVSAIDFFDHECAGRNPRIFLVDAQVSAEEYREPFDKLSGRRWASI